MLNSVVVQGQLLSILFQQKTLEIIFKIAEIFYEMNDLKQG